MVNVTRFILTEEGPDRVKPMSGTVCQPRANSEQTRSNRRAIHLIKSNIIRIMFFSNGMPADFSQTNTQPARMLLEIYWLLCFIPGDITMHKW